MVAPVPAATPQSVPAQHLRRYERHEAVIQVSVMSGHNFWTGLTQNISKGGLFVASAVQLPVGTSVSFAFQLDPDPMIHQLHGTVRWVRPSEMASPGLPAGMGVELEDLSDELMRAIGEFIETRRDSVFFDGDDDEDPPCGA